MSRPDALYEVADGEVVELPARGAYAYLVAYRLLEELRGFLAAHRLGVADLEAVFVIDGARDLRRRPEVAFLSFDRWAADREVPDEGDWPAVPELAVEVLSPNDRVRDLRRKIREYFLCGLRRVWVVLPDVRQVQDYTSPSAIRLVDESQDLDEPDLLPSFRLPIAQVFRRTLDGAGATLDRPPGRKGDPASPDPSRTDSGCAGDGAGRPGDGPGTPRGRAGTPDKSIRKSLAHQVFPGLAVTA